MTDAEEELLPPAEQHAPVATLSKNAQKRLVKQAQWEERKQAMKAQRKAKAKQESERRRAELQQVRTAASFFLLATPHAERGTEHARGSCVCVWRAGAGQSESRRVAVEARRVQSLESQER
jgi:hypothetical protein